MPWLFADLGYTLPQPFAGLVFAELVPGVAFFPMAFLAYFERQWSQVGLNDASTHPMVVHLSVQSVPGCLMHVQAGNKCQ